MGVGRLQVLCHHFRRKVVGLGQPHLQLLIERLLANLQGMAGFAGDGGGQAVDSFVKNLLIHHPVHQTDLLSLQCSDHLAG